MITLAEFDSLNTGDSINFRIGNTVQSGNVLYTHRAFGGTVPTVALLSGGLKITVPESHFSSLSLPVKVTPMAEIVMLPGGDCVSYADAHRVASQHDGARIVQTMAPGLTDDYRAVRYDVIGPKPAFADACCDMDALCDAHSVALGYGRSDCD